MFSRRERQPPPAPSVTVLVADANEGHRSVLEMVLSAHNYRPVCVANGYEALTYLKSNTPELMFLDIDMPMMGGLDVCDRVKRVSRLRAVPVVLMTSRGDEHASESARAVKADLLLSKPFTGKNLSSLISDLLGGRRHLPLHTSGDSASVSPEG